MSLIITEEAGIQRSLDGRAIRSCHKVMRQFRPHSTEERAFVEQVQRQLTEGYHLSYCQDKGGVIGLRMTGQLSNHFVEGMRKIYELEPFIKMESPLADERVKGSKIYKRAV